MGDIPIHLGILVQGTVVGGERGTGDRDQLGLGNGLGKMLDESQRYLPVTAGAPNIAADGQHGNVLGKIGQIAISPGAAGGNVHKADHRRLLGGGRLGNVTGG